MTHFSYSDSPYPIRYDIKLEYRQYWQGNIGLPLGDNGFLNLSGDYYEADATLRGAQYCESCFLMPDIRLMPIPKSMPSATTPRANPTAVSSIAIPETGRLRN